MTIITSLAKIGRAAAADLQPAIQGQVSQGQVFQGQVFQGQVFQGQVFLPSHEGHSELKLGSNGAEGHLPEDHLPTVIARCETRKDVQLAVRTARAHGLAISVSGGEFDPIGRVLKRGGMVIDLSATRHVAVDPATRVAIVAGGATVNDVVAAAAAHGLTPVTGNYGAVSLAGVTLAGGYGPLLGRYGLAADNLLEVEIVLKNGQCRCKCRPERRPVLGPAWRCWRFRCNDVTAHSTSCAAVVAVRHDLPRLVRRGSGVPRLFGNRIVGFRVPHDLRRDCVENGR